MNREPIKPDEKPAVGWIVCDLSVAVVLVWLAFQLVMGWL